MYQTIETKDEMALRTITNCQRTGRSIREIDPGRLAAATAATVTAPKIPRQNIARATPALGRTHFAAVSPRVQMT